MERVTTLPKLPPRPPEAHKGAFGTVLVVGGSRGMAGAAALAGRSALAGGAGLVRLAVPDRILDTVAAMAPACTSLPLPCTPAGRLHPRAAVEVLRALRRADVLALGPGLGCDSDTTFVVRGILENISTADADDKPVVVDADGLNCISRIGGLAALASKPKTMIITPHPGEAARLLRTTTEAIQSDREASAAKLAAADVVALLKGHQTVVTDGRRIYINQTGNPGMATGGSGDVLTGLIAALLAQGLPGFEAAVLGAHYHGLAGDQAARQKGEAAMTAEDVLNCLPGALLVP